MKRIFKTFLTLALALIMLLPAFTLADDYAQMTISINDPSQIVATPDYSASVTVSGGSGSFTYQWMYTKSVSNGMAKSPAKGSAIKGQTAAAFNGIATNDMAGKYLYCCVTDSITGAKAYSQTRKLMLLPPVATNTSPQSASITYTELRFTLADSYPSNHSYAVDKYGAAAAKSKNVTILGGGSAKAKAVKYDKSNNTFTITFDNDISKFQQPFAVTLKVAKYVDLTLNISGVTPTAESVSLSKATANLAVGDTLTLKATPSGASWTSSNQAIATVSSKGVVKAIAPGTATITVTTKKGGTATCAITVMPELRPVNILGTGSVQLNLSTGSKAACYKLYYSSNTKGTPVRLLFLEPNTSGNMYFAPGTYVLKTASGTKWYGDDQAFGKNGSYSKSDPYYFEAGYVYNIKTSTNTGDFSSISQGGFVG